MPEAGALVLCVQFGLSGPMFLEWWLWVLGGSGGFSGLLEESGTLPGGGHGGGGPAGPVGGGG